ncbi:MAG: hypothetical protein Q7U10_08780 [Thermodesulfovibrionia bacterium]|nr:hypothetical protein [Thermodesulfovibrionia bacterium]
MLILKFVIDDKNLNHKLDRMKMGIPAAIQSGIEKATKKIHREAHKNLSGAGAKSRITGKAVKENGKWKIKGRKNIPQSIPGGGWPVPVRTGWLRQMLYFLLPGETSGNGGLTVTAGHFEGVVYNAAEYADVIHEGRGSSRKFGKRPFITQAANLNLGSFIESEIDKVTD